MIAPRALREFWKKHPEAETAMRAWLRLMQQGQFQNSNELRATFPSADYTVPYTIFNIGGNHYRVIAFVRYTTQTAFIKFALTHREYTVWSNANRKKGKKGA